MSGYGNIRIILIYNVLNRILRGFITLFCRMDVKKESNMSDYKFDFFYYSEDLSNEHYLAEIEDLSDEEYAVLYKDKMYCPLCKGPQLGRVRQGDISFLRKYPKQLHRLVNGEMCSYECDTASKEVVEEYIQELKEKKKIKSLLEATMRKMFNQQNPKHIITKNTGNPVGDPLVIERIQKDKTVKRSIIPHYSFMNWGKDIPQDRLLLVWGKVFVEQVEIKTKEGAVQTYIHFKNISSKQLITSCIKPYGLEIEAGYYYVVVLGMCRQKESKGHTFYNIWINSPVEESIMLKPFSYKV